jgi:hydrogenase expression/formation protein HypC
MCVCVVARVLSVDDELGLATVVSDSGERRVSVAPVVLDGGQVAPDDWVVVHSGFAVEVLDADDAATWLAEIAAITRGGSLS